MNTVMKSHTAGHGVLDQDFLLSINGQHVDTDTHFDVLNPANNAVIARAPEATKEHLEAAVVAAQRAFPAWSARSWQERSQLIQAYADALETRKDDLITLLTLEQGKPRHSMATGEVEAAIYWVREMGKRQLPVETIEDTDDHVVEVHHVPLGVVGAITPWNFPVLLGLWKVSPCLVTGNTMILKPSPYTPLTSLFFGQIAQTVLPPGVLNVVSGGNDFGQWMSEHSGIAKISFTGSCATGRKVIASGAVNLKRVTLELGGNDAAVVLPDTDWKSLIPTLFWAAFGNSGQWCIAVKRLYVHASFHAEFVTAFVGYARDKVVGDGMDPATDIGPIQTTDIVYPWAARLTKVWMAILFRLLLWTIRQNTAVSCRKNLSARFFQSCLTRMLMMSLHESMPARLASRPRSGVLTANTPLRWQSAWKRERCGSTKSTFTVSAFLSVATNFQVWVSKTVWRG